MFISNRLGHKMLTPNNSIDQFLQVVNENAQLITPSNSLHRSVTGCESKRSLLISPNKSVSLIDIYRW